MNLSEKLTGRSSYQQYWQRLKINLVRPGAQVSSLTILTIFTVIFFLVFAILPTFKTIAALKREIADARTVDAKLSQKIHSLNQAETLLSQVAAGRTLLDQVLPETAELERLAWQIHWLAREQNLTVTNGSFEAEEKDFVPVSLSLAGSYPAIKKFAGELNRIDRLISLEELTINSKALRPAATRLTANLKLKVYFLPRL